MLCLKCKACNIENKNSLIYVTSISMNAITKDNDNTEIQSNMSEIDSITLDYFTNKSQYANLLKKKDYYQSKQFNSDKKFYKKRILDLFKRLFRDEIENEQLVSGFHNYIKLCIDYLKVLDTNDLLQEKYADSNEHGEHNEHNEHSEHDKHIEHIEHIKHIEHIEHIEHNEHNDIDIIDTSCISIKNISYQNCDHLFAKVEQVKKVNLDSFIINNTIEKTTKKILPVKEEVNIKTKIHKTKGIMKKKKTEI